MSPSRVTRPRVLLSHVFWLGLGSLAHGLVDSTSNFVVDRAHVVEERQASGSPFLNDKSARFSVNGSGLPGVVWDVGESFAGQLPTGDGDGDGQLFFWFWPTTNASQPKEIVIWLGGGPGCSSLTAVLQGNGPISWPAGTAGPVANAFSWHRLSNVVYVDQPVGTGFSTGAVTAREEDDVACQFMGFWSRFVDMFALQGFKVYVAGESYAGMYAPYISKHFLDAHDTARFDLRGMLLFDPLMAHPVVQSYIPARQHAAYWAPVFPLDDTARAWVAEASAACGYDAYLAEYLRFPPKGPQPVVPPGLDPDPQPGVSLPVRPECKTVDYLAMAANRMNPGWSLTDVTTSPLTLSSNNLADAWLNRADVKQALHAPPNKNWTDCTTAAVFATPNGADLSPPSSGAALPAVIDATRNVLVAHGTNDILLTAAGSLLALQNVTWGGRLGFQAAPTAPLFVPVAGAGAGAAGAGVLGTTHHERGLTWAQIVLAGHFVAARQPAAAMRLAEALLGRVSGLSSTTPFTVWPGVAQPAEGELGNGTAPAPWTQRDVTMLPGRS